MQDNTPIAAARPSAPERWLGWLSALPVALIVAITFADVFGRYVFSSPLRGGVEIIEYAMALVIFTALPLVTRRRGHVTVSLIDGLFGGLGARIKTVLCDAISAVALGVLTWRLSLQGLSDLESDAATVVLGLPQAPLGFVLTAFAAVSTFMMLLLIWNTLAGKGTTK